MCAIHSITGVMLWENQVGNFLNLFSHPIVANDIVYIGNGDSNLYALNASTGDKIWEYKTGRGITTTASVSNGVVYIASGDQKLYAIGGEGTLPLTITTITPSSAPNTGPVSITNLTGTGFASGAIINLTKTGETNITATDVTVISPNKITCTFPITGKKTGLWNVVVEQDGIFSNSNIIFTITHPSTPEPAPGWKFRGNLGNTGEYDDGGIHPSNITKWVFEGGKFLADPVLSNNCLYICSYDKLYALNSATGDNIWEYELTTDSSPAVINGVLYVSSYDKLYALNSTTGDNIWEYELPTGSSPAVIDGVLYVSSSNKKVYALNSTTGVKIWEYDSGDSGLSSPAVSNDFVFICSIDKVYALNSTTGVKIWEYDPVSSIEKSPVVSNSVVYVVSIDYTLYALDAIMGDKIWDFHYENEELGGGGIETHPAISNGVVYIGGTNGEMFALNSTNGEKIWEKQIGTWVNLHSDPAVSNGVIYIGNLDHQVYAVNSLTGDKIWEYPIEEQITTSPAIFEGVVYIGSDCGNFINGKLYAIGGEDTLLPDITSITPSSAPNTSLVSITNLTGTGFASGAIVNLTHTGETNITATDVTVISPNKITCTFPITGKKTGLWNVVVEQDGMYSNDDVMFTITTSNNDNDLPLYPGWNFISVPKTLQDGNNTPLWLDQYVNPEAHSMWGYNGETASWVQMTAEDIIIPLDGYWLWNAEETTVPLTFKDMGQQLPPTKNLFTGWNAIGFTATIPATARDTLLSVQDAWVSAIGFDGLNQRYENGIINGGSGQFADTRLMNPGHGYWLYMDDNGVLSPLSG